MGPGTRLSVEFYGEWQKVATELLSDSVAQLVRSWQAICHAGRGFESLPESLPLYFLVFISRLMQNDTN